MLFVLWTVFLSSDGVQDLEACALEFDFHARRFKMVGEFSDLRWRESAWDMALKRSRVLLCFLRLGVGLSDLVGYPELVVDHKVCVLQDTVDIGGRSIGQTVVLGQILQ